MFLAEAAEKAETVSKFQYWDLFMIAFTIVIAWALVRTLTAREKNVFAIGFSLVSLLVFLYADYLMVLNWMNRL
ncbi:DUF2759 family protein [Marinicrinis sediminis]|uniref:DUF2759 family protein n=1 Tax=Marinicrinis sediminis TaxID=1652465 RepID=A0ABW5RB49_9BACL